MIHGATDCPSRAVRRVARTAGPTAALCTLLLLTEQWTRLPSMSAPAGPPLVHHAGALLTVVALGPSIALLPVAVRLLAHPRRGPLPASAATGVVTGVVVSLSWIAGGLALLTARWLASGGPAATAPAATRAVLTAAAAAIAGGVLLSAGQVRSIRAASSAAISTSSSAPSSTAAPAAADSRPENPGRPARPDLVDDLVTVSARAWPGSAVARAAARLNRRVDDWATAYRLSRPREAGGHRLAGRIGTRRLAGRIGTQRLTGLVGRSERS